MIIQHIARKDPTLTSPLIEIIMKWDASFRQSTDFSDGGDERVAPEAKQVAVMVAVETNSTKHTA